MLNNYSNLYLLHGTLEKLTSFERGQLSKIGYSGIGSGCASNIIERNRLEDSHLEKVKFAATAIDEINWSWRDADANSC